MINKTTAETTAPDWDLALAPICGVGFGARNVYSEAVGKRLRQHCDTAADGAVEISRTVIVGRIAA